MDSIVKRLSEIETSADSIVEHAESQKEVLDREMAEKKQEFDEFLKADTENKLKDIRAHLESRMSEELTQLQKASDDTLRAYNEEYEVRHEEYARAILARITEVA